MADRRRPGEATAAGLSRRTFLAVAVVGPALAATAQPAAAAAGSGSAAAVVLPAVDMEAVVEAAQWDPAKLDSARTAGAGPSVRLVEAALRDRGLLPATYVDGHFGTRTLAAYARWQRQLGYTGIGATGLPGTASLKALGVGRFTVARPLSPGARRTYQGFPDERPDTGDAQGGAVAQRPRASPSSRGPTRPRSTRRPPAPMTVAARSTSTPSTSPGRSAAPPSPRCAESGSRPGCAHRRRATGRCTCTPSRSATPTCPLLLSGRSARTARAATAWRTTLPDDGPQVARTTYEQYLRRR